MPGPGDLQTIQTPTPVLTAGYTAKPGDLARVDATAGNVTITLPAEPPDGTQVTVRQVAGGNTVTVACAGADCFDTPGGAVTVTLGGAGTDARFQYHSGTWVTTSGSGGSGGGGSGVQIGGDLGGTNSAPVVDSIQGLPVAAPPSPADASAFLGADGNWAPVPGYYPLAMDPRLPGRKIITQFQAGHGWTFSGGSTGAGATLNDTTAGNFVAGSQAVTCVTKADGSSYAALNSPALTVDATGKYLMIRYRLDHALNAQALHLDISSDSGYVNYYRWAYADLSSQLGQGYNYDGEWEQLILSFADATVTGTPNRAAITNIRLRARDFGNGGAGGTQFPQFAGVPLTAQFQEVSLVDEPKNSFPDGVVSICFDDIYQTQYDNARPVMDAYGFRGTIGVIRDAIGGGTSMSLAELQSLQNDLGWEIGLHADTGTVHAANDVGTSTPLDEQDYRHEKNYFAQNGLRSPTYFTYPGGFWDPATTGLVRRYFQCARVSGFWRTQETFPPAQPHKLRSLGSISTFTGGRNAATVNAAIDAAKAGRSWLILVFHKILATGTPAALTELLLSDFQTIMAHLAASGMPVRTVTEVMHRAQSEAHTTHEVVPGPVQTAAYTAQPGELVPVNTTGGAVTITLPAAPADLTRVAVYNDAGTGGTTVARGGADTFADGTTTAAMPLAGQGNTWQYSAAAAVWYPLAGPLPLAGLDLRYAAYGGGGGGVVIDTTDNPLALGTAAPGTVGKASDAGHVHPTTGLAGGVTLDTTGTDIQDLGTQAAGSSGLAADAKHVHQRRGYRTSAQYSRYRNATGQPPRETIPFHDAANNLAIVSGIMYCTILPVMPGDVITSLGFVIGSTAAVAPTHSWTALYDAAWAGLIAQSADQGSAALGASSAHLLTLQSPAPYTVPASVYEVGAAVMIAVTTTMPTIRGAQLNAGTVDSTTSLFPSALLYAGTNGTALTTTAPAGPLTVAPAPNVIYLGGS